MPLAPFVHPWIAASAAVLAAVPIIIHVWNRRRFRRVVWAAMGFLAAAQRRSARRVRIEQLILLAVRVSIMALIALAVARPLLTPLAAAGLGQISRHHVIVLDDSYSMGMVGQNGERAFDAATRVAAKLVGTFGRNDGVSLILAGRPAGTVVAGPTYDHRDLLRALEALTLSDAITDMAGALKSAAEILSESDTPPGNCMVYVVTDGTRAAWSGGDEEAGRAVREAASALADRAKLSIVDVSSDLRGNLTVASLRSTTPAISMDWPATLVADVANHGRQEARDLRLQIVLDGQIVRTETIRSIRPADVTPVRFRLRLPGPGSHRVQATVSSGEPDALPRDDVRWLSMAVPSEMAVLLVDGRPGPDRFSGQTGYLAAALAPETGAGTPTLVKPRSIMAGELTSESLADYAMVALCNVRQPGREVWARLDGYVRQGGGLVVFMGDQIDLDHYNRFGLADGRGVLPARIDGVVGNEDDREAFVRLSAEDLLHPSVSDFAGQPRSGLFLARFYRHTRLVVPPELDGTAAALRYDNGDCAVAARSVGRGRVVMAGFSANMDWTNLPAKGDYVSLMMGLLTWVVGDPASGRNVRVGQPLLETLTGRASTLALAVAGPGGREEQAVPTSRPGSDGIVARYDGTDRAGGYTLTVGSRKIDFSVNLDPTEGDLTRIDRPELEKALGVAFEYTRNVDDVTGLAIEGARHEIGRGLLWAVLGLLGLETLLALWFGHHRD